MVPLRSIVPILSAVVGLLSGWTMLGSSAGLADFGPKVEEGWALEELVRPDVVTTEDGSGLDGNGVDFFIGTRLKLAGLEFSPQAEKRELIRRLYFDVVGLPPSPADVNEFVADDSPGAYEKWVDRLLADSGYGEKWARFWLDLVHFAETHGHDEDAIRENAWPYRDYVIRALNEDRPYGRFIEDQIAGDVLYPEDPGSLEATGFLAAGPWDGSSQMGIQDGTVDKKIAQLMDRDDMVTTVMSTFTSMTAHCARCHDHKFDPISLEDYYALQAVFAGVDRADREYDRDPKVAKDRAALSRASESLNDGQFPEDWMSKDEAKKSFQTWARDQQGSVDRWSYFKEERFVSRESGKASRLDDGSWLLVSPPAEKDVYTISGRSDSKTIHAVRLELLTDDSLPHHGPGTQDNGNLHLSEIRVEVVDGETRNPVELKINPVADFNQSGWGITRAVDGDPATAWGIYPQVGHSHEAVFYLAEPLEVDSATQLSIHLDQLHGERHLIGRFRISFSNQPGALIEEALSPILSEALRQDDERKEPSDAVLMEFLKLRVREKQAALPPFQKLYTATSSFQAVGNFKPAGGPREVRELGRGSILLPGDIAQPGSLSAVDALPFRMDSSKTDDNIDDEGARRAWLAKWISDKRNPLTWRSIANRIWQSHFGRGLVDAPNDFGVMGARPSHPDLLDWLACELRDNGGSLKALHKTILMSRAYRQSSHYREDAHSVDPDNRLYWRANLRHLTAEEVRDAVLSVSGSLDRKMGGPSARQFLQSKGVHVTPTLDYLGFDPENPNNNRRSVYRFIFRTVPDPFMKALNCADTSQLSPKRREAITPFQSLALMNNRWVHYQSGVLANRLQDSCSTIEEQVQRLFELAYSRPADVEEIKIVSEYAESYGLDHACRMVLNSSEFLFIP